MKKYIRAIAIYVLLLINILLLFLYFCGNFVRDLVTVKIDVVMCCTYSYDEVNYGEFSVPLSCILNEDGHTYVFVLTRVNGDIAGYYRLSKQEVSIWINDDNYCDIGPLNAALGIAADPDTISDKQIVRIGEKK